MKFATKLLSLYKMPTIDLFFPFIEGGIWSERKNTNIGVCNKEEVNRYCFGTQKRNK